MFDLGLHENVTENGNGATELCHRGCAFKTFSNKVDFYDRHSTCPSALKEKNKSIFPAGPYKWEWYGHLLDETFPNHHEKLFSCNLASRDVSDTRSETENPTQRF